MRFADIAWENQLNSVAIKLVTHFEKGCSNWHIFPFLG